MKSFILRVQQSSLHIEHWIAEHSALVRWVMVFAWYTVIFVLSALPAASSRNTKEMLGGMDILNMLFRMAAHAFVFAVLAAFIYLALNKKFIPHRGRIVLTHIINAGFAFSDELHQLYVPGRFFRVQDIVTDVAGGVLAVWLLLLWFRRIR
jgi:VanZ family protein